jgi:hypothetical protein
MGAHDEQLPWLQREAGELVAIFAASCTTASRRHRTRKAMADALQPSTGTGKSG